MVSTEIPVDEAGARTFGMQNLKCGMKMISASGSEVGRMSLRMLLCQHIDLLTSSAQ